MAPLELRFLGPDTPEHAEEWRKRWPLRKFPLLVDNDRNIVETSIIIEYLQLAQPGPARLLPDDPMAALEVRFLDRFFDLHVMSPMQHAVSGALTGGPVKREDGVAFAREKLDLAYAWLETQLMREDLGCRRGLYARGLRGRPLPALCRLEAPDFRRLPRTARLPHPLTGSPAFARAVDEARPYRKLFPLGAPNQD